LKGVIADVDVLGERGRPPKIILSTDSETATRVSVVYRVRSVLRISQIFFENYILTIADG
jgi:hypothetical protein